jgi:hypothetical protein
MSTRRVLQIHGAYALATGNKRLQSADFRLSRFLSLIAVNSATGLISGIGTFAGNKNWTRSMLLDSILTKWNALEF